VRKVQLTIDNEISKWSVGRGPFGLSINTAQNLLVACCYDDKIQEYNTTSGSLVREIRLKSNDGKCLSPWHAVQLIDGQIVVSCRVDDMFSGMYDVVEVDVNGRVLVSYTNRLQSTAGHSFSCPRHLVVDKDNKRILVTDVNSNTIVMLNRRRNSEFNVMLVDGELQQPSCLHFNEAQGRLFVGELSGKHRVLVFENV
jgi:DNA-binding beta-propeller fold protein YncE